MVSLRDQTIKQLRDEIAALKAERDEARKMNAWCDKRITWLNGERDRLRALLREVRELVRQMVNRVRQTDIVYGQLNAAPYEAWLARLDAALEERDE